MNIKLLILDVDGTLTDGTIYYGDQNIETKAFSVKDGAILKPLSKLGIQVIILTGRDCAAVERRSRDLNITPIQGIDDKVKKLTEIFAEYKILPEQTAYIGDDLNDYAAMKLCGFKACPADAAEEIKAIADYVSPENGGHGAVRDIVAYVLKQMNQWKTFLGFYGV